MGRLMGFIGGKSGYRILRKLSPGGKVSCCGGTPYGDVTNKLDILGSRFWKVIKDSHVVDFGCGYCDGAIDVARRGAAHVVDIDIREDVLDIARQKAIDAGVESTCRFLKQMTVRNFIRLVERSPLQFDYLECVPIRQVRWFHNRLDCSLPIGAALIWASDA